MKRILVCLLVGVSLVGLNAQSLINNEDSPYKIYAEAELGFVGVLNHTFQNGASSTNFNYKTQGGQDILFPITRLQAGLVLLEQHHFNLLYQPLELVTNVTFRQNVIVDSTTFVAGTPMELTYSFPFWRFTYLYDFFQSPDTTLAAGLSLQIRNASIKFKEIGGTNQTVSQNTGPVPALSFLYEHNFDNGLSLGVNLTGSYASSAILNGATFSFEGSLLDASVDLGFELKNDIQWYLVCRFLGGSATGNSEYVGGTWTESQSSYTDNRLATLIIATGVKLY